MATKIQEIQVSFLANVPSGDDIVTRNIILTLDPKDIVGDYDVAQINGFFVRLEWQPETPIEFKPSPYYLGP